MRNRLYWILAITLVLGIGAVLGAGLVIFGARTQTVQASGLLAENRDAGILVGAVQAGSPAAKAGLVRGDIIVEVNGTALDGKSTVATLFKDSKVGDTLTLKVLHGDVVRSMEVTLVDQNGKPFLGIIPAFTNLKSFSDPRRNPAGNRQLPGNKFIAGAQVVEVVAGGPAEKAGIKVGDILLKVNDQALDVNNDLAKLVAALKPGASVKLNVQRKGETAALNIQVTLGDNPEKTGQAYLGIKYQMPGKFSVSPKSQTPNLPNLPQQAGLVVTDVKANSPAVQAGLKVRDMITEVNAKAVTSADDFVNLVKSAKVGEKLTLTITRMGEANALKIEVLLGANPDKSDQAYLGISIATGWGMHGFPGGMPNGGSNNGRPGNIPPIQGSNS